MCTWNGPRRLPTAGYFLFRPAGLNKIGADSSCLFDLRRHDLAIAVPIAHIGQERIMEFDGIDIPTSARSGLRITISDFAHTGPD